MFSITHPQYCIVVLTTIFNGCSYYAIKDMTTGKLLKNDRGIVKATPFKSYARKMLDQAKSHIATLIHNRLY